MADENDEMMFVTLFYGVLDLKSGRLDECGSDREVSVLRYARKLCLEPENMTDSDLQALSSQGWSEGEILEVVQVVATFSYFVRVINALGVSLKGERIGLYGGS